MTTRLGLGAVGVVAGLYGLYELLDLGFANLLSTAIWLVGGVILHDGVLAFATIAAVTLGTLVVPQRFRAAASAGLLVLGTVTIAAVPVLGRFGARSDNTTLLDRNYLAGWLVFAGLVCAVVAVMGLTKRVPERKE